ncbi:MAG TPA: right-handed parallel beta-helix repeat-containing protein, partial [bacterium]
PTGTNVQVVLSADVTVIFDNVTGAGVTTLNKKNIGAPPPGGLEIIPSGSPFYYDINTTATYTGNITISIKYDDTGMTPAQEQSLKLQVYEVPPGSWKDITTSKDMTANIISGKVTHLTDFAVMISTGSSTETITVTSPNGGEVWQASSEKEITWTSANFTGQVRIEGSIDGGSTFEEIIKSTENDGSYMFVVPNQESNSCVVKISDAADGDPFDVSDGFFTIIPGGMGGEIVVINTNDSGPGSLRDAITQANTTPGEKLILFQIPKSDPGYDMNRGVWTITPQTEYPIITGEQLVLDGYSQSHFIGDDTNPHGPEIEISGLDAGEFAPGLQVHAPGVSILGLIVNNFSHAGIIVSNSEGGRISGCYIGTNFSGMEAAPNNDGIWLYESQGFHISPEDTLPNVISGNRGTGLYLNNSTHNFIFGNLIGLKSTMSDTLGNLAGISIQDHADSNEVIENRICGNNGYGIFIFGSNANFIAHNFIGRHFDPEIQFGNIKDGIMVTENSQHNMILENMIGHNGSNGVFIFGNQAIRNTISRNSITNNASFGIENRNGGNSSLSPPQIQNVTQTSVSGTAPANSNVEIFFDRDDEGEFFIADVLADGSGNFNWSGEEIPGDLYVTATATDTEGNTSQFSNAVKTAIIVSDEAVAQKADQFALHQNYPNPFNPTSKIRYEVPQPGNIKLSIFDMQGREVRTLVDRDSPAGSFDVTWDGRDNHAVNVASGVYLYRLVAQNFSLTKKMI